MDHSPIDTPDLGDALNRYGPTAARSHAGAPSRPETRTIDVHSHVLVPEADAIAAPHIDVSRIAMARFSNDETKAINKQQDQDRRTAMTDMEDRLKVLDAMRVDFQLVAPPPPQCYYHIPAEPGVKAARAVNEGIAAFVARRPDRFAGLGTVPLQDPAEAVTELERCVRQLGLKGVEVLTNVNGEELAAPKFEPFWKKAEELGALVMIHPNGFTGGERFTNFYFSNIIGNPLETATALHYLIFSGTLERMPDLKILAVHGGGFLPAYAGRIDHAWGARQDCRAGLPKKPSEYLRKVYLDTVVFTSEQLEHLVRVYGADRIVMGTDYPYDMGEYDPVGHVMGCERLSAEEKARVAGGTAMEMLGLSEAALAKAG